MAWPDAQADEDDAMIALHARRSAASIAAWHARYGATGLAVVLTGTDLYRDIETSAEAQCSLRRAQALVVLQELGVKRLPAPCRGKARTIFQSATSRKTLGKPNSRLRALMVGHLREEKSPQTLFAVAHVLKERRDLFIDHIGSPLDPVLAEAAQATQVSCPHYRWLGGRSHEETRRRIQRAHVLIHASRMEGGAHVLLEAAVSGTPVLASHIDGNIGMLGGDYAGYFPWDDAGALADLLVGCRETPAFLAQLQRQIAIRAPLFAPAAERAAVRQLVADLLV
jgi:putative glycosyltransferase (TIGR04348 family)